MPYLLDTNTCIDAMRNQPTVVRRMLAAGPVTVLIVPAPQEDDAGDAWMDGVARQWADDLSDERQDIYTLAVRGPIRDS